jgi:hypothetical protein
MRRCRRVAIVTLLEALEHQAVAASRDVAGGRAGAGVAVFFAEIALLPVIDHTVAAALRGVAITIAVTVAGLAIAISGIAIAVTGIAIAVASGRVERRAESSERARVVDGGGWAGGQQDQCDRRVAVRARHGGHATAARTARVRAVAFGNHGAGPSAVMALRHQPVVDWLRCAL